MSTDPREQLGRLVRETWVAWVAWAREQADPGARWLTGWDDLDEGQREAGMRIGEAVAAVALPCCPTPCDADCEQACHEVHDVTYKREHNPETCVGAIVAAAVAAERERIRALAVKVDAFYDAPCPDGVADCIHQDSDFADLLREGP
jgi:hypothetical protein